MSEREHDPRCISVTTPDPELRRFCDCRTIAMLDDYAARGREGVNVSRSSWWDRRDMWPDRLRSVFVCSWRGHVPQQKFGGDWLCRRCGRGVRPRRV